MAELSEEFISVIEQILQAVLYGDNQTRPAREMQLAQLNNERPNEVILALLQLLKRLIDPSLRMLSAVLLRQRLSILGPGIETWKDIRADVKEAAKLILVEALNQEADRIVRRRISDAIAGLAVTLLSSEEANEAKWDELLPYLLSQAASGSPLTPYALQVIAIMAELVTEVLLPYIDNLISLFSHLFTSEDLQTRSSVIATLCSLLPAIETYQIKRFMPLAPAFLQTIAWIVQKDEEEGRKALERVGTLVSTEPKLLKHSYKQVYELTFHLLSQPLELSTKSLALELLVGLTEHYSTTLCNEPALAESVCSQVFQLMISIDPEIDESWSEATADCDEDIEIDYAKSGRKLISRLIESVGDRILLPVVLSLVQRTLSNTEDWRMKYAGIMTISEICNLLTEPDKVALLVPLLLQHLSPTVHPKIRFAVYQCFAQLSEDMQIEFQAAHHAQVAPVLLEGCLDSVPRVASSACAAVANFMENCPKQIALQYATTFITTLSRLLATTKSQILVQNILSALSSIAEGCAETFGQFYKELLTFLVGLVQSYSSDNLKTLRGKAVECLTQVCKAVGRETFKPDAPQVIALLLQIQETQISQKDPLKTYMYAAWQRLCVVLRRDFAAYIPKIVPSLLHLAAIQAEVSISTDPNTALDLQSMFKDEGKRAVLSITTSETEEIEVALQALLTIMDEVQEAYLDYVEPTMKVVMPLVNYEVNENIRASAASTLAALVQVMFNSSRSDAYAQALGMARISFELLWTAAQSESEHESLYAQLEAIKNLLELFKQPILNAEEVNAFGERAMKLLSGSLERRAKRAHYAAQESDEEDEFIMEINSREEDQVHIGISEVLGALFKTHTELSINIINYVYSELLSSLLAPEAPVLDHKLGIFIIDDIIEFVGPALVHDKWLALQEALVKFADSKDDAVRQAAVYGLGQLAVKTTPEMFQGHAAVILQALERSLQVPKGKSSETHGNARDNAVAAIGRIIKHQNTSIDCGAIITAWLKLLPMKHDKVEAKSMHDLLAELIIKAPQVVFGADNQNLGQVVLVFSDVIFTKYMGEITQKKVKKFFTELRDSNLPQLPTIWSGLTDQQKNKISQLLSS
mmetsp:Transcript_11490/g.22578  ORF Transcript_11490/g.22578 Transcript_11490/m.22578 type:complete len:1098 (+) Transcript_11490:907-4200(+)|eukprot:CAMPEP_0204905294 /NCGR_PEP_ID=MMETSP1397-20131031/5341_1 /ASSEMBLY_ACC=CAM_ASM_000891 /TAXON_ID=49980 /ORGANISM="Climacostomum Climacostomum virens, Strain Stock W-24" /LENGTH=1097 /DNA_ID=CAMNT_0052074165 /DNA_START=908 /DNA_END=4201 /DNA_ORIENTATION=+